MPFLMNPAILHELTYIYIYEVYRKVPRLGQKRNVGLTYSILATMSFKIVSLGKYTAIPLFSPCFKSIGEVIFLNAVEYHLQFPVDVNHCFKALSLQFHFQYRKRSEITGG
jgi:hypothetical protein